MATVTIELTELDEIRTRERKAIDDLAKIQAELVEAKKADPRNRIAGLLTLSRTMLDVVRFAVGNLPPETIRNWPVESLRLIARDLKWLPDFNADDESLVGELMLFAREIERVEAERKNLQSAKQTDTTESRSDG